MRPALFVTTLLLVTACDAGAQTRREAIAAADGQAASMSVTPTLMAGDDTTRIEPDTDQRQQWSAAVVRVDYLENQGFQSTIKLYGTAGGDPAMNGLYTHLAVFEGVADGWRVFRIGDFLDYRVMADAPGRVDLEVRESVLNPSTDEITSRTRRLIITWEPVGPDGAPDFISISPALDAL